MEHDHLERQTCALALSLGKGKRMKVCLLTFVGAILLAAQDATGAIYAAAHAHAIIAPKEGHAGSTAYLSGSGFSPNRQLVVSFSCFRKRGFGITEPFQGPSTDSRGQFVAYPLHLAQSRVSTGPCKITARDTHTRGISASASYTIVAPKRPLTPCATRICLAVKASLVRLKSGAQGNIVIHGWPGASTTITIQAPGRTPQRKLIRLNWQGTGALKTLVAPGLNVGLKSRIQVRATLGKFFGSQSAHFIVIPGGR